MDVSVLVAATRGLHRSFGQTLAVRNLTLAVPERAVYGFLGPNGAGKTTTIRLLLGLLRPHSGSVELFGRPIEEDRRAALARVGSLVEAPSLYPHLTGRENLEIRCLLRDAPKSEIDRVLAIARLEDGAARRAVRGYSLGMRQRLALAQALLGSPQLLILDEPTNGLDPAGIREMRELLAALPGEHGVTVFLSSHLLAEVEQVATHVGILSRGTLLFEGTLAELHAHREERIVVGVDRPADARARLAGAGFTVTPAANGFLRVAAPAREAAPINALLVGAGIAVHHLAVERPSLEEAFMEVTENSC